MTKFWVNLKIFFSNYYSILITLSVLTFINFLFSYKINFWTISHEIINNSLISYILYLALTYTPQKQEKWQIKKNINLIIQEQKKDIIQILLIAADLQKFNSKIPELTDIKEFKTFFKKNDTKYGERWYAVCNGLDGKKYYIDEILDCLDEIIKIMELSLSKTKVSDITVLNSINWLSTFVKRNRRMDFAYDNFKTFIRQLYGLLSSYSWIEGYTNKDPFQEMLKKI